MMEFHISRYARDLYDFDESLFSLSGNVILTNFHASRIFAQRMNSRRDLLRYPETAVRAGQINAMGLIDEILHFVVHRFQEEMSPKAVERALRFVEKRIGKDELEQTLLRFTDHFPPVSVYRNRSGSETWLKAKTGGIPHRRMAIEELLFLWLANQNPAFSPYLELFDDEALEKTTFYLPAVEALGEFFEGEPCFGPDQKDLITMLRSPAMAHPHSLSDQLEYIRRRWGYLIGDYLYRLLGSLDLIEEEQRLRGLGAGPARVVDFAGLEADAEAFSTDLDWMPRVVMMAKNTYVWLDQLSKRYQREVRRLDQVPDEELERLARWGFTALWLIGLWERSSASKRIKQMCGNPEAEASAYSLARYDIAAELGGWEAFNNLKGRAWQRGIRMAGDMVPNHMGIDSLWVIEHPDWFISLPYSPFPAYSFGGTDLSGDSRAAILLEDHYYSRSDAAVVFKHVDRGSGAERYIYHGNDGTSMPWNDTAQLNFLNPEVREAVIRTILHVARSFPIIRFDAAMTLTKKHFQRLWFPEPGSGGDIPSRADQAMSRLEFDKAMPVEFWREVVDRIALEAPDTLLLAEAFWMLEGYFVRTLGMHRVYNSAFMNMLKNEMNGEYRQVIKNTLEFNPEVLKRFVNFMNNPDEETAVAQFGKGDKYIGVCLLMATLPGLPMFGHGQVEGLTEKYGMEYRRAYWNEADDPDLVQRHEREVFPLLHKRALFAGVQHFLLYDFHSGSGVNQDVFAYSNRSDGARPERALVVYHNRYAETAGWIHLSCPVSGQGDDGRKLLQRSLGEGLGLSNDGEAYCIFRDHLSGLEYLRPSSELHRRGLYVQLQAYNAQVFLDFREVQDRPDRPYAALADYLNGRGVPNIEAALQEILLKPVHQPLQALINSETIRRLLDARRSSPKQPRQTIADIAAAIDNVSRSATNFSHASGDAEALAAEMKNKLLACLDLPILDTLLPIGEAVGSIGGKLRTLLEGDEETRGQTRWTLGDERFVWATLLGWLFVHALGGIAGCEQKALQSRSWIDEWLLGKLLLSVFEELGMNEEEGRHSLNLIKVLTSHQLWFEASSPEQGEGQRVVTRRAGMHNRPASKGRVPVSAVRVLRTLLSDTEVQEYLRINRYQDILWFHGESMDRLLAGLFLVAVVDALSTGADDPEGCVRQISARNAILEEISKAKENSDYRVENLLAVLRD
ncbi:MAG: alpha-amylase [Spirochaetaceae bacterium]|nr:MAG: alpha-amylase [Spirochaetaceae bacterium]